MIDIEALFKISYGLYIVSSGDSKKGNGFISNTVFQVTSEPARFVVSCNKNNYTSDFIQQYNTFSVSILSTNTPSEIFGTFGYKSGRDLDKFEGLDIKYGETGVPIVLDSAIAYLEFKLERTVDVGTHIMFIGKLVIAEIINSREEPITYSYYRNVKKGLSPKNAPTYIDKSRLEHPKNEVDNKKYKCEVCGYIHDNSQESIEFNDLSDDWVCPICGAEKSEFSEV